MRTNAGMVILVSALVILSVPVRALAAELDAKRAIRQGTELAAAL